MPLDTVWNQPSGGGLGSNPIKPAASSSGGLFGSGSAAPSSPALASSQDRLPPERIDVNSIFQATSGGDVGKAGLQLAEVAGKAPGYVYERPVALLDTLGQRAGLPSLKNAIGDIPILGDLVGGAGDVLANVSNFIPAFHNSQDLQLLGQIPDNAPDDMAITALADPLSGLVSNLLPGLVSKHRSLTVGQFREEMGKRGFTAEDVQAIRQGVKSIFDYGDHALSDDPLKDVGFRLTADPLNLFLGTGLLTKAARGVGLLAKATAVGAELKNPLRLTEAIEAVAAGNARAATWAGVAGYAGEIAGFAGRARAGAFKLGLGVTAAEFGIEVASGTPLGGFMGGLTDLNREVMDNHILSDNAVFSIWSAFHFPLRGEQGIAAGVRRRVGDVKYAAIGSDIRPKIVEALTEGRGIRGYQAKLEWVHERIGGPDGLDSLITQTLGSMAHKKVAPILKSGLSHFDSLTEAVLANKTIDVAITEELVRALESNTIRGRDVVAAMKEWYQFRPSGDETVNRVAFPWDGELAAQRWTEYSSAAAPLSQVFHDRLATLLGSTDDPLPAIGLSGVLSTHDLNTMQVLFKTAAKDGYVDRKVIERVLSYAPQLIDLDKRGFWERQLVEGQHSVKLDSLVGKLGALKKDAPTLRDLTHEFAAAEASAPRGTPTAEGPLGSSTLEGTDSVAVINASRWSASDWGVRHGVVSAAAERARPEIQAVEHNIGQALDDSGFPVQRVDQTVGNFEANAEPSFEARMGEGTLQDYRLAGTLYGRDTQDAVLLTLNEAEAQRLGVAADGREARWYLPESDVNQLERVATLISKHFPGWTLRDADNLFKVSMAPDWIADLTADGGLPYAARIGKINAGLRRIYKGDAVGDRGIAHSVKQAYVESIGREDYNHVTYERVLAEAGSDPRIAAWSANSRRLEHEGPGSGSPVVPLAANQAPADVVGYGTFEDIREFAQAPVADKGYLYHVTSVENAADIASDALRPQGPGYRGEQMTWPWSAHDDYVTSRRSYWNRDVAAVEKYTPGGKPAILRVREAKAGRVRNEPTGGDQYTTRKVLAKDLEILGGDGQWHPLRTFYEPEGGSVPASLQPALDLVESVSGEPRLTQAIRADQDMAQVARGSGQPADSEYVRGAVLFNAQMDEAVRGVLPLTRFEHGGINAASEEFRALVSPIEQLLHEMGPQYTIKPAPKLAWLYDKDAHGPVISALRDREGLALWLLHDSPLAPVSRFLEFLSRPVTSGELAQASRQALYAELVPLGATTRQVDRWVGQLAEEAKVQTIGPLRIPLHRGAGGNTANAVNDVARRVFPKKVFDAVGEGKFQNVLDGSLNRFIRDIESKRRAGTTGRLQNAVDDAYRGYQTTALGGTGRVASKVFYHLFRFVLDPRWWAMNYLEADVLGGLKYGRSATRLEGANTAAAGRAAVRHNAAYDVAAKDADTGWLYTRNLAGYISRAFDADRPETILTTLRGMDEAGFTAIRKLFPDADSNADLVAQIDDMLYSYDTKGVGETLADNLHHFGNAEALQQPGAAAMIQRIWDANQRTFDDIVRVFEGNANRSTVERLLNSYWLYWPLSYQLKAGRWLLDTLTHRAFGRQTNLAGAATYAQMVEIHRERVHDDPEYADIFSSNPTFWQMSQMLLPITPGDLGVSLSRPVRYGGSFVRRETGGAQGPLGFWGDYKASQDPVTGAAAVLNLGLPYTLGLLTRVEDETLDRTRGPLFANRGLASFAR